MTEVKEHGRVYTPSYIVNIILDYGGYNNESILRKNVIDNSCGDGAFLIEIAKRYCNVFLKTSDDRNVLKTELETYIHGIELDGTECSKCKKNLDEVVKAVGISNVNWDILNADTLQVTQYNDKMDYVFGNPPYVRVHNLDSSYDIVKQYSFSQGGMTDLYIVFFELGFRMLSNNGTMCLITPSSWLTSVAGSVFRQYLIKNNYLSGVIDLAHFQPFTATTYTLISRFSKKSNSNVEYNTFDSATMQPEFRSNLTLADINIDGLFYLSDIVSLKTLKAIRTTKVEQKVKVKNGFATLADKVFIGDWKYQQLTIDVVKASTGKWTKCIFPYKGGAKVKSMSFGEIQLIDPDVAEYLLQNKHSLCKGDNRTDWYLFGRTQALNDVNIDKLSISSVIKDISSIKLVQVSSGKGVYGGLYIISSVPFPIIERIVLSKEYVSYIKMLKNYKSGGYYTCSGKDIELFINYKLSQNE